MMRDSTRQTDSEGLRLELGRDGSVEERRTRERMSFDFLAPSHALRSPMVGHYEEVRSDQASYGAPVQNWLEQ